MNVNIPTQALAKSTDILLSHADTTGVAHLVAGQDVIFITTSNHASRLSLAVPATISQPGTVYTSMKRLHAVALTADNDTGTESLLIEQNDGNTLSIHADKTDVNLPIYDADSLIPARTIDGPGTVRSRIDPESFLRALTITEPFIDMRRDVSDWTSCFSIEANAAEGIVLTSDKRQICSYRFKTEGQPFRATIPRGQLLDVVKMATEPIEMTTDNNIVRFKTNRFLADFCVLNQNMPPIRHTMLKQQTESTIVTTLPIDNFLSLLELTCMVSQDNPRYYAYLDIAPDTIKLRVNGDRIDEIYADLRGTSSGSIRFFFDHTRLFAAIRHFKRCQLTEPVIFLRFSTNTQPTYFSLAHDSQDFYCLAALVPPPSTNK